MFTLIMCFVALSDLDVSSIKVFAYAQHYIIKDIYNTTTVI